MLLREEELIERFARFNDEELERALAAGRAKYSWDELMMASWELSQRRAQPPAPRGATPRPPAQEEPPAARVRRQSKSPYMFIDLLVDALLVGLVYWALGKLEGWTQTPWGRPWDDLVYYSLALGLLCSVTSLRQRWREKEWRD